MDSSPSQCSAALAGRKTANKPKPVGLSHHFSETTKRRVPNKMKQYYKYFAIPGIGNLAGGMHVSFLIVFLAHNRPQCVKPGS